MVKVLCLNMNDMADDNALHLYGHEVLAATVSSGSVTMWRCQQCNKEFEDAIEFKREECER